MSVVKRIFGLLFLAYYAVLFYLIGRTFTAISGFFGLVGLDALIATVILVLHLAFALFYGRRILDKYLFQVTE